MIKQFTLSKKERLKSRKTIQSLFVAKQSIKLSPLKIMWQVANNEGVTKTEVAFSVPKKNFRKAVTRNKIKRQLREAYRINKFYLKIPPTNITPLKISLMLIYVSNNQVAFEDLEKAIKHLLIRLSDEIYNK